MSSNRTYSLRVVRAGGEWHEFTDDEGVPFSSDTIEGIRQDLANYLEENYPDDPSIPEGLVIVEEVVTYHKVVP